MLCVQARAVTRLTHRLLSICCHQTWWQVIILQGRYILVYLFLFFNFYSTLPLFNCCSAVLLVFTIRSTKTVQVYHRVRPVNKLSTLGFIDLFVVLIMKYTATLWYRQRPASRAAAAGRSQDKWQETREYSLVQIPHWRTLSVSKSCAIFQTSVMNSECHLVRESVCVYFLN